MTEAERNAKLEKIRGLLAQAESTPYPEEANTFSAKAQELMAQYSIDEMEVSLEDRTDTIDTIEMYILEPYGQVKVNMLARIAHANDCKLVQSHKASYVVDPLTRKYMDGVDDHGIKRSKLRRRTCWVTGFTSDLEHVQMLYTSLLVQGTREMLATPTPEWENGVSFRNSFWAGYGEGISARLGRSKREAVKKWETTHGTSLSLVTLEKAAQVDQAYNERWGKGLRKTSQSYVRGGGAAAGRAAANRSDVGNARISGRKALGK